MMEQNIFKLYFMVWFSLLIGMILTIMPLPEWGTWVRPRWVLLIILFWCIYSNGRIGIGTAWLAGLFVDLLTGTLLGQHALVMCILSYIAIKISPRFRHLLSYQQILFIALLVWLDLLLNHWLMLFVQQTVNTRLYWVAVLTSAIIWPWINVLLRERKAHSLRYY